MVNFCGRRCQPITAVGSVAPPRACYRLARLIPDCSIRTYCPSHTGASALGINSMDARPVGTVDFLILMWTPP
ncbi:hypothetical protein BCEN4_800078 [Burkholderia cenocepacia]|nr:hypothetical protein BCEN4_800078 [Burkholderia cenocepacia]